MFFCKNDNVRVVHLSTFCTRYDVSILDISPKSILHLVRATNVLPTLTLTTRRHLLQVMGKGIPDIVPDQQSSCREGSCTADEKHDPSLLEGGRSDDESRVTDTLSEHDRARDGMFDGEGGKKEAGVDKRIHILDRARRWMADAGAKTAAACSEARASTESDAHRTGDGG